jgi:DNA-binding response OmpR family regulator
MKSQETHDICLNPDGHSFRSLDLLHCASSASENKVCIHPEVSMGSRAVRIRTGTVSLEVADWGTPLERPPLQRSVDNRETILRVGPLQLDLIDRTAKRVDRAIDLLPREFRLLKYMMQHSDQLLTRSTLLESVWHYKFIPKTNLVDVHMSRVRQKVDGPNETRMIYNVRGCGFLLRAPS